MTTVPKLPHYDDEAACRTVGFGAYFSNKGVATTGLQAICESCIWLQPCAEYAIHHDVVGYWGGLTANMRRRIRRQRGIIPVPLDLGGPQNQDGAA